MGDTYSNIFRDLTDKFEFAHVYLNEKIPTEKNLCRISYCIPYNSIKLRNKLLYGLLLDRIFEGYLIYHTNWGRTDLYRFIDNFNPDILFIGNIYGYFGNRIAFDIYKRYNIPIISYLWDDRFNHHNNNKIPINEYIKTSIEKRIRKKVINHSTIVYTISPQMQEEYNRFFPSKCLVLNKMYDFSCLPQIPLNQKGPIKVIYMGTLCNERDQTLFEIIKILEVLNREGVLIRLDIYTTSKRTCEHLSKLNHTDICSLNTIFDDENKIPILRTADILLHVEPFSMPMCNKYRLSLSSKIVDYFYSARCIVSIGGLTGTVTYLLENDAAIVETKSKNIYSTLKKLCIERSIIHDYALKAWNCGVKHHNIKEKQQAFLEEVYQLV